MPCGEEHPFSFVHVQESTVDPPVSSTPDADARRLGLEVGFRHSHWQTMRRRIYWALMESGISPHKVHAFANCGSRAWVLRSLSNPSRFKIACFRCRNRLCQVCQRELRRLVALNLYDRLRDRHVRFLTLTVQHRPEDPLKKLVDHLYASFRRLRSSRVWKSHVTGGVCFLEVKRSLTGSWHPHLHILFEGRYFPQPLLKNAWAVASRGSTVVDIRDVRSEEAVTYVVKYASKVASPSAAVIAEIALTLQNRRTFLTFGNWTRWRLTRAAPSDEAWEFLFPLADLLHWAQVEQQPWAVKLLEDLVRAGYHIRPEDDADDDV